MHILQPNSRLHKDRGCLVLDTPATSHRLPLGDILAVVIAARGVCLTADALSALLACGAVIVHCNEKYRPLGKTVSLAPVIRQDLFERQIALSPALSKQLWQKIIISKIANQAACLENFQITHQLARYLPPNPPDEGNAARQYWKHYFRQFGRLAPDTRTRQGAEDPVNSMLNYGYAVLSAILHRSICAHGLNPALGIHHKYRFRSDPLVYDLFEPWRPVVDYCLWQFRKANKRTELTEWVKYAAKEFLSLRLKLPDNRKVKLFNAMDFYVQSVCNVIIDGQITRLFLPDISEFILEKE